VSSVVDLDPELRAIKGSPAEISFVQLNTNAAANKTKEQQWRYYICLLHKVVDKAGAILLVLDACDPVGCRSRLVEEEVRRCEAEGKRLVLVLNKIGA
jgi:nuclear GTP-binding protein